MEKNTKKYTQKKRRKSYHLLLFASLVLSFSDVYPPKNLPFIIGKRGEDLEPHLKHTKKTPQTTTTTTTTPAAAVAMARTL